MCAPHDVKQHRNVFSVLLYSLTAEQKYSNSISMLYLQVIMAFHQKGATRRCRQRRSIVFSISCLNSCRNISDVTRKLKNVNAKPRYIKSYAKLFENVSIKRRTVDDELLALNARYLNMLETVCW